NNHVVPSLPLPVVDGGYRLGAGRMQHIQVAAILLLEILRSIPALPEPPQRRDVPPPHRKRSSPASPASRYPTSIAGSAHGKHAHPAPAQLQTRLHAPPADPAE